LAEGLDQSFKASIDYRRIRL